MTGRRTRRKIACHSQHGTFRRNVPTHLVRPAPVADAVFSVCRHAARAAPRAAWRTARRRVDAAACDAACDARRLALSSHQLRPARPGHPRLPQVDGRHDRPRRAVRHPAAAGVARRRHRRERADLLSPLGRAALLLLVHRRVHRDAVPVASAGGSRALRSDDHRLQPRATCTRPITSAACCTPSRASSTGIGEFTIHKEFVSDKVRPGPASLLNPALDSMLDPPPEIGLVVDSSTTTWTCRSPPTPRTPPTSPR